MKTPAHLTADRRRRALGSLAAVVLVLLVCWGQLLSLTACPLQGSHGAAQVSTQDSGAGGDCELSTQLLSFQPYAGDIGLPVSLGLLLVLVLLSRRAGWGRQYTEPIGHKRRRHLQFCVFRE